MVLHKYSLCLISSVSVWPTSTDCTFKRMRPFWFVVICQRAKLWVLHPWQSELTVHGLMYILTLAQTNTSCQIKASCPCVSPAGVSAWSCTVITGHNGGLSHYKRTHWFWRGSTGTLTLSTAGTPAASSLLLLRNSLAPVTAMAPSQPTAGSTRSTGLALSSPVLEDGSGSEAPETTGQQTTSTPRCTSSVLCHWVSHLRSSEQNQSDSINHVMRE